MIEGSGRTSSVRLRDDRSCMSSTVPFRELPKGDDAALGDEIASGDVLTADTPADADGERTIELAMSSRVAPSLHLASSETLLGNEMRSAGFDPSFVCVANEGLECDSVGDKFPRPKLESTEEESKESWRRAFLSRGEPGSHG